MTYRKHDDGRQGSERNGRARRTGGGHDARHGAQRAARSGEAPARSDGPCPVMRACGGCELLGRPYHKQLSAKQLAMQELFAPILEREGIELDAIRGMGGQAGSGKLPAPRGFRHKAGTPFAPGPNGSIRCGFFARGTHDIIEVPDCIVEARGARAILAGVARAAEELGIPAYDEDACRGILRYAVLRIGWKSDEAMLTVVTAKRDVPRLEELGERLLRLDPRIVCVAQNVNPRRTNAVLGGETRVIAGAPVMRDQLLTCEFEISPAAFYQVNPEQTELLYSLAIDGMGLEANDVVLDAYCGSGTIGLCALASAREAGSAGVRLLGVERNAAGIADARRNADLNGLSGAAEFVAQDATAYLLSAAERAERVDVLSIDPPRAGSTPEFLDAAAALGPRRIVYISCNPETQARDLEFLLKSGYRLMRLTPVDMFPHTSHVETVAVLERRP